MRLHGTSQAELRRIVDYAMRRLPVYPDVCSYLRERGITDEDLSLWDIGYYDRPEPLKILEDRVLFPIYGHTRETLVSVAGRALRGERPKYWHTPFVKRLWLYGLWVPCRTLPVLVEGQMDVIALRRLGWFALSPMGTSLSPEQAAQVTLYGDGAIVLYDRGFREVAEKWRRQLARVGIVASVPPALYTGTMPRDADPDWLALHAEDWLSASLQACAADVRQRLDPLARAQTLLRGKLA